MVTLSTGSLRLLGCMGGNRFTQLIRRAGTRLILHWKGVAVPVWPRNSFLSSLIDVDTRPCEFELPTAGDVEWLLFSYT